MAGKGWRDTAPQTRISESRKQSFNLFYYLFIGVGGAGNELTRLLSEASLHAVSPLPGREAAATNSGGCPPTPRPTSGGTERATPPRKQIVFLQPIDFFDLLTFFSCFHSLPCLFFNVTKDKNV